MNKFLQFFSVAALTQIVLALSQIILLPLQIRFWGHGVTASWYAAIALAAITTVSDCGLRTAGHAELLRTMRSPAGDAATRGYFAQVWGWIRVLVIIFALVLIAGDAIFTVAIKHASYAYWKAELVLASAFETLLIVRITYLDTLGLYRGAEASYFFFAGLRLALAVPALLIWKFHSEELASLFLFTSILALTAQEWFLCRDIPHLRALAALPRKLSIAVLTVARHTLAEPFANWARLSLPVLVVSTIALPTAVTIYVALRAAFGAGRTTIQQLARVASVEYLRFRSDGLAEIGNSFLTLFVLVAVLAATSVAGFVVVDNLRIIGLWLSQGDRDTFQLVAISFGLSAAFYAYQIVLAIMFRTGELAWIARRHWAYVIYAIVFAIIGTQVKSLSLYLALLTAAECALSISFMFVFKPAGTPDTGGRRGLLDATIGSAVICSLWLAAKSNFFNIFDQASLHDFTWSALMLLGGIVFFLVCGYLVNAKVLNSVPLVFRRPRSSIKNEESIDFGEIHQNI